MANVEILPDWAARYIQENLSEHMHVVNVLPIDKGAHSGSYLINTSKGAVLVQKGRMSEVTHWFMPLPGEHVSFRCEQCSEAMELVDPDVPRVVYCSSCGKRHYLVIRDGRLRVVSGEEASEEPTGHQHDGYTLFRRGEQHFFAKTRPDDAEPAQVPDGFAVQTNPRTGIPELVASAAEPETYYQFRGDVHDVIDVEGIGPAYAKKLKAQGVETTARLLYEDAASLATRIDVPQKTVQAWQAMAELMLVKGVGKQYAEALVRSGVEGIQALKSGDAETIAQQVSAYLEGLGNTVLGQKVTSRRVKGWQDAAASMRRVRSKVPAK